MLISNLSELKKWCEEFILTIDIPSTIVLNGEMGAGKTTLTSLLCGALGMDDVVSSPTFALVQEYHHSNSPLKVLHFDLYRLKSIEEAFNAGIVDLIEQDNDDSIKVIEWHQIIAEYLPEDTIMVSINLVESGARTIEVSKFWEE
ncbi:MAG: tRNA (adenosine(37)-N6)-threonylcarbamoyltransferase complex ATPase subunit type 1 TsaE [Saprospiraceae bacterium]|nr:tRNA (adenosine(37)-N6)-threonylcarbamoyltransferase complex ATPase subunit type 1 TsaE [Saprospiraceae bacterium]